MFNATVAQLILEVLDEAMKKLEVFTAYDITIAARGKTTDNVKHADIRNIIENEFVTQAMTGYDRELCTLIISDSPQAQVYFPDSKSASDHDLVADGSDSSVSSDDSISDTFDSVDDSDDTTDPVDAVDTVDLADGEVKTTAEGRVQIPRTILKQVTPNAGSYDIQIQGGSLKCAKADARGDVRVCLKQFGIDGKKVKLTVDVSTDTINLEAI